MAQLGSKQKRRSQITNRVIGTSPLQQRPKHKRSVPRSAAGSGPSRDGPRLAQGLCPLSQHVSLCPTCLAPLHPFPAMRPDWHKAQRGALFKALLTTRQSLRGIKNTTLATTPLPMTNHPSFLRKHPEDRCNKLVKCVGLPRVLRVRGCLSEGKSRAESWWCGWVRGLHASQEHPTAPWGVSRAFTTLLYQPVSQSSRKQEKK